MQKFAKSVKHYFFKVRGLALAGWIGILTLSAQLVALMLLVVAAAACPRKGKEVRKRELLQKKNCCTKVFFPKQDFVSGIAFSHDARTTVR